ncbi:TerD family protein [Nocardia donostiensis]|uniref:Transporter n=1 Tax=Nocardia donostiensis TaxID=1538463 RepID=A0A1W0AQ88_9NOCA|nr:TerD family protein [Nocardia donostiensis]ONM45932.1 transporter [Nocardia donostiensis]OQS12344.1 transporter [Nocardia donostiensis]OQS16444.1 transporter [Nocardia donostiensis]
MIELQAGQNIPLTGDIFRFRAEADTALEISALVVAPDLRVASADDWVSTARPQTPGVELGTEPAEVTITPAAVRADAQAVLLVVSTDSAAVTGTALSKVAATLHGTEGPVAEFVIAPAAGETALICLEVYRRGPGWKLRALGQGYAGGLADLLRTHGADAYPTAPQAPQTAPATQATAIEPAQPATQDAAPAQLGAPLEVGHGLERLWMIFEDAARSAAALGSARDYAGTRLDQELSAAVSDPATRNTPAADAARVEAQRKHDELISTAELNHLRDSEQLRGELAEADQVLPPSLASWDAPAWDRAPAPADGIRLGELYGPGRGPLRIPYCVPVPLNRPLWVDTESSAAVAPVVGALLARLLAAAPQRTTLVDIIDLTGAFTGLSELLAPVLAGPPVTDIADISPRLQSLVDTAELAEMAHSSGAGAPPTEHRVLLAADFPHGYHTADVHRLGALLVRGDLIGLSTVIVGPNESDSEDGAIAALSRSCRHLPTVSGTPLFDPWTNNAWQLDLDLLPQEPERQARFLRAN